MSALDEIRARSDELRNDGAKRALWATDEVGSLIAAVDAVLEKHTEDGQGKCAECTVAPFSIHSVRYPCPTREAITEALGAD